jgi:hypothetical protein
MFRDYHISVVYRTKLNSLFILGSSLQDSTELSVIIVPVVVSVSLIILVFIVLWYDRNLTRKYIRADVF